MFSMIKGKLVALLLGAVGVLAMILSYMRKRNKALSMKVMTAKVEKDVKDKATEAIIRGIRGEDQIREEARTNVEESKKKPVKRTTIL